MGILDIPSYSRQVADGRFARPVGNTVGMLGSSYVQDYITSLTNGMAYSRSIWNIANIQMGHRYDLVYLDGIDGSACTDPGWAARVASLAASPCAFAVLEECFTNAVSSGQTLAAIQTAITASITTLRAVGKTVVIGTCPPRNSFTSAKWIVWSQLNTWLRQLTIPGVYIADQATWVTDPTSAQPGFWASGATYSTDGVHPSPAGAQQLAKAWVATMTPLAPPTNLLGSQWDSSNLLALGAASWAGGAAAKPTSWTLNGGAGAVWSQPARTDGRPGVVQQVVNASGVYSFTLTNAVTTGFAPGDRVVGYVELLSVTGLEATPNANSQYFNINLRNYTSAFATAAFVAENYTMGGPFSDANAVPFAGVYQTPTLVIPGTGTQELDLQIALGGGGTFQFGRVGIVKVGATY